MCRLPSKRRGKQKRDDDKSQTSLFSFVDDKKKEEDIPSEKAEKKISTGKIEEKEVEKPSIKEEEILKSPPSDKK